VLDKIKPGVDLLEEIIRLGRTLIKGLMSGVTRASSNGTGMYAKATSFLHKTF
jgi:hypothetical protein